MQQLGEGVDGEFCGKQTQMDRGRGRPEGVSVGGGEEVKTARPA